MLQLTEVIRRDLDAGLASGVVALDLSKAFDTIEHYTLLRKLEKYGLTEDSLRFFTDYLEDRCFKVKYMNKFSASHTITKGVPQGSILGSLLFSIYVNDLPEALSHCNIVMYADDTTIQVSSMYPSNIQVKLTEDLKSLSTWFKQNGLKLNTDKTEAIIIASPNKIHHFNSIKISLQNKLINCKEEIKILGIHISKHLKWDSHTSHLIRNLKFVYRGYSRSCRYLSQASRKLLYNSAIGSRVSYCDQVWDKCGSRNKKRLQTVQNRCVRRITGSKPGSNAIAQIKSLGWLNLETKRRLHKCVLLKKIIQDGGPDALRNLMTCFGSGSGRGTRLTSRGGFTLPTIKTDYYKNSFLYDAVKTWNSLPAALRETNNINTFKENLHKLLAYDALDYRP